MYRTIDHFLEKTGTALTNAQEPEILRLLAARGLSGKDIQARQKDADALRALHEKQKAEYGEQYEATEAYQHGRDAAHEVYMDHLQLCRVAFKKDIAAKSALGLGGNRAQSQSGYIGQGLLFYNNALGSTAYQETMRKVGISAADLKTGQAAFRKLQALTAAQQKETGEAQEATQRRDAAYDALNDRMNDFYDIAKVALRRHPQWMERLGIKDAS